MYKNIISEGYAINWSNEILVIASMMITNPWMYKSKDLSIEVIERRFYKRVIIQSQIILLIKSK